MFDQFIDVKTWFSIISAMLPLHFVLSLKTISKFSLLMQIISWMHIF